MRLNCEREMGEEVNWKMYAHVVDLGVSKLELTNYVAGVRCDDAEAYD